MEWISVKDRLPEQGIIVIAHQFQGLCRFVRMYEIRKPGKGIKFLDADGRTWLGDEVTHWMEHPGLPEESQSDPEITL